MKTCSNARPKITRVGLFAARAVALAISLSVPALSFAQSGRSAQSSPLTCSWPVVTTGSGITNVAFPDTDATYWTMPVDPTAWRAIIVTGEYPQTRFFSFTTYVGTLGKGDVVDSIIDANIAPDSGNTNPFQPGDSAGPHNYTISMSADSATSGNHLALSNSKLNYIVYRVYVPDKGLDPKGGVPLPAVTFIGHDGKSYPVSPCQSGQSTAAVQELLTSIKNDEQDSGATPVSCTPGQPESDVVTFETNPARGGRFFPNPATTYVSARGLCPQPNKIIVIRGKAAVFPDTHNGSSIFQPAIPGDIQMRYWSMCNNEEKIPFPVVACQADWATSLDDQKFYTYVMSQDPVPPSWLPADATWLPWGDPTVQNVLLFREMLPMTNFTLTGDYYPKGAFCDTDTFIGQGWQACFKAAGITPP